MSPKDTFNAMIEEIEKLAGREYETGEGKIYLSNDQVLEKAFKACGISTYGTEKSMLNTVFKYMVGMTLKKYVDERRMMAIYEMLLEGKEDEKSRSMAKAAMISGMSDQSGFIHKFHGYFNTVPSEVYKNKDVSLLLLPLDWDTVSSGKARATNLLRFKNCYKLNDREDLLATSLINKHFAPVNEIYEYIYNYLWQYIETEMINSNDRDSDIEFYLQDERVIKLYFEYGFSFDEIFLVLLAKEKGLIGRDILNCDRKFLEGCVYYMSEYCPWVDNKYFGEPIRKMDSVRDKMYDETFEEVYRHYLIEFDERYTKFDYALYVKLARRFGKKLGFRMFNPGFDSFTKICKHIRKTNYSINTKQIVVGEDDYYREEEECEEPMYGEMDASFYEGEEKYVSSGEEEFELEYDYEPDFDDNEFSEYCYLGRDVEDEEYAYEWDEDEEICWDEMDCNEEDFLVEFSSEQFVKLCQSIESKCQEKRFTMYKNLDVKSFLKDLHMKDEEYECFFGRPMVPGMSQYEFLKNKDVFEDYEFETEECELDGVYSIDDDLPFN